MPLLFKMIRCIWTLSHRREHHIFKLYRGLILLTHLIPILVSLAPPFCTFNWPVQIWNLLLAFLQPVANDGVNNSTSLNYDLSSCIANNSRCCCKEMPSTTGWNHDLPALYWNQQSCFSAGNVRIPCKRILCETRALIASKRMLYELDCIKCRGRILHDEALLKTTFVWSAGKNNPDFISKVKRSKIYPIYPFQL